MDRRKLEIIKLVRGLGLVVESIERPRSSHYHVIITDGKTRYKSIFPGSASDHRWLLNKRSEIRRAFRQE